MPQKTVISPRSRRIARNTVFLYIRMLVLMVIGLFTSRIVLSALGINDYGTYNAIGGIVALFSMVTASISTAISRFLAYGIAGKDTAKTKQIFSTALLLQIILCALLVLLTETLGLWFVKTHLNIPPESATDAVWILQCTMGIMIIQLMSVPFNALIIAHENMNAYAYISILEAILKLSAALALLYVKSATSTLILYAILMVAVQIAVRATYGVYCHKKFAESHAKVSFHKGIFKEMFAFAGWNFYGTATLAFSIQGITVLMNLFFGVVVNAARGITMQVEGLVKQFVTNFLTAINPQITKSHANGEDDYCHELVCKGAKFSSLILLVFIIPLVYEADTLLALWLKEVPEGSVIFVRLSLLTIFLDFSCNTMLTLIQASGKIRNYYLVSGTVSALSFFACWVAFHLGAPAYCAYIVLLAAYMINDGVKLYFAYKTTGICLKRFFREAIAKPISIALVAAALSAIPYLFLHILWLRLCLVVLLSTVTICLGTYLFCLTTKEKLYLAQKTLYKIGKWLPDRLFLRLQHYVVLERRCNLRAPQTFNEKLQWLKLHDHNPLYKTLCDKDAVKQYVAEKIGREHIIPTLGKWNKIKDIDWDALPRDFVLKCTHDSGSVVICRDSQTFDKVAAIRKLGEALKRNFYRQSREWAYKNIRPQIIAEPYLGELTDYKFFCFNGIVRFLYLSKGMDDHETAMMDFVDVDSWTKMPFGRTDYAEYDFLPPRPENLSKMVAIAQTLSKGLKFVRVDLYSVCGTIYFSEFTLYPCGGYIPFKPKEYDKITGEMLTL